MSIPTNLTGNVTSSGVAISYGNIVLGTDVTIDTTSGGLYPSGADITINGTIDGNYALTLNAGNSGTITLSGSIGGTTPLTSLTIRGSNIAQSSTVQTTGLVDYTGTTLINVNGNITTCSGSISLTGPATLGASSFDTTCSGLLAVGASITFSSTLDGAVALTLNGGTGGVVTMSGNVGGVTPLSSLTIAAGTITQSLTLKTTGALSYTGGVVNIEGDILSSSEIEINGTANLTGSFGNSMEPIGNLTINSAQSILNPPTPFSISSTGNVSLNSTNGDVGSLSSPISINATGTITVGGKLAAIKSTENSTILADSSNPPSAIYLNGKAVV